MKDILIMEENIFNQVDSFNKAYWLGFIAADGSVHQDRNCLEIGLSSKDREHLEKFIIFINGQNEIQIIDRQVKCKNRYYNSSSIFIYNKVIKKDLEKYGIIPNKTYSKINYLNYIPEEYKFAFICGFFDGDGWFVNTKNLGYGMCNLNEVFLQDVSKYLSQMNNFEIMPLHTYLKSPTSFFQTQNKTKLLSFVKDYLSLKDKCDLLKRKKETALSLLTKLNQYFDDISLAQQKRIKMLEKICPICGKMFYIGRTGQKYCSQICNHKSQQKVERPSKEELKQLIRTESFLSLGQKYGVSDKAITKWCIGYGLPSKKREIIKYSDEEWDKI